MTPSDEPVRLPTPPAEPAPVPFPVIASVAPLIVSGVIWAITGSAFVLLFAVLGPVIAVASLLDGRRSGRATRRKDAAAYAQDLDAARASVAAQHSAERSAAWQRLPKASRLVSAAGINSPPWPPDAGTRVVIGSGSVPSTLRIEGGRPDDNADLRLRAATLDDAPVTADSTAGIGIVGAPELARGVARGIVVQLARAIPPGRASFEALGDSWAWVGLLPHADHTSADQASLGAPNNRASQQELIFIVERGLNGDDLPQPGESVIAISTTVTGLPAGCATILQLRGSRVAEIVRSPDHEVGLRLTPDLIGDAEAVRFAERLQEQARDAGLLRSAGRLPPSVQFAALPRATAGPPSDGQRGRAITSLACTIGVGQEGAVSIDLAAAGPHAVVGGTTGSGKSELLVTWITSLAGILPPSQVNFLLVDFKGGAAFSVLRSLPHCVGLITDLAASEAARALASLRAEIRFRERMIQKAGARDISDPQLAGALPRLVIVVDEFQAMLNSFPELHTLFVDIAARGRSLGVHLILCTQRPAGVVGDALLANCSLRISLRVNNRADSQAVVGVDAAAAISPSTPGRCIVESGSGELRTVQVATCSARDIRSVADRHPTEVPVRRPWLDPLPTSITLADLDAVGGPYPAGAASHSIQSARDQAGHRIGIIDDPEHQRYLLARWDPASHGHLLVIGGTGTGKSALVDSLVSQSRAAGETVASAGASPEETWDILVGARSTHPGSPDHPGLLFLDDFDAAFSQWDLDYQLEATDVLAGLLRAGRSPVLVVTVQRLTGAVKPVASLFSRRLILGMPSRDEHREAGGTVDLYDPLLPPGGGSWDGLRVQLISPTVDNARGDAPVAGGERRSRAVAGLVRDTGPLVIVAAAPAATLRRLNSRWPERAVVELTAPTIGRDARIEIPPASVDTVFLGDPDAWQGNWTLLSALRRTSDLVFDGCGLADYRAISRRRELPPPLSRDGDGVWLLRPDGTATRAEL